VVERLVAQDWIVVGIEVDEDAGRELRGLLGPDRVTIGDAADRLVIAEAIAGARRHAPLGGWVSNAGVMGEEALHLAEPAAVERILHVNLMGAFWGSAGAVKAFLDQASGGAIVNVSSVHARFGYAGTPAYDVSKAGIEAVTRYVAVEYGPVGIRANTVAPGGVDTPLSRSAISAMPDPVSAFAASVRDHPLGRIADSEEIAAAVVFLLSNDASFINGATLAVDGGLTARCTNMPIHGELREIAAAFQARSGSGRWKPDDDR